jgi:hypothetical protein
MVTRVLIASNVLSAVLYIHVLVLHTDLRVLCEYMLYFREFLWWVYTTSILIPMHEIRAGEGGGLIIYDGRIIHTLR